MQRSLHSSLWKTTVWGCCLWLRTGGSDNCALLLAVVATNFPQGSLGFSLLMCVNSLASIESAGSSNYKNFAIHTLYTAHTRALLMGVTNSFLKRVVNQLWVLLNGSYLTLVSALLPICLWVNWFCIDCTRLWSPLIAKMCRVNKWQYCIIRHDFLRVSNSDIFCSKFSRLLKGYNLQAKYIKIKNANVRHCIKCNVS